MSTTDAEKTEVTTKSQAVDYKKIAWDGLWENNPGLVQLLGLCPLLAVTNNVVNAMGLAIATLITLVLSNTIISASRKIVRPEIRIPLYVLIIASVVTIIDMSMNAVVPNLHSILGIFIPLIVTNCAIIGRAEAFASKNSIPAAAWDGLMMGLGFGLVLIVLGGLREIIGSGTFLANASLMFGESASNWTLSLPSSYKGLLLAILPPGAFIGMGLIIAAKNYFDAKTKQRAELNSSHKASSVEATS